MKYKILFLVALLIAITIPVVAQKGNADNHVMSKNQTFKFIYVAFDKQMNKGYKKECAIGYVGGIVYSKVLVNKVDKAINQGVVGTESLDW